MGKINLQRVILGGLLAGLVLNVVDYLMYGVLLKTQFDAAMQALGKTMDESLTSVFVILDFLWGIMLVYLYAAIRPRFGAGPKTAVYAGLIMWVIAMLFHAVGEAPMGLLPMNLWMIMLAVTLVLLPVAAVLGAKFYTEV